jgi:hypothetical protein
MITLHNATVRKLIGRGFTLSHKRDSDTVYLWKRAKPWKQVLALVRPDGSVNGGTAEQFLETV